MKIIMEIRKSTELDNTDIVNIHTEAFGIKEGPEIADLVLRLLVDDTAAPLLSLVAVENKKVMGHILFTKADIPESTQSVSVRILAPLAVLPESQRAGIGGMLINDGMSQLKKSGVDLVFVLGHPDYYPRFGFTTAGVLGYEAPYPIPEEVANAWMVQALSNGIIGKATGKIQCSEVLNQPEHWRE